MVLLAILFIILAVTLFVVFHPYGKPVRAVVHARWDTRRHRAANTQSDFEDLKWVNDRKRLSLDERTEAFNEGQEYEPAACYGRPFRIEALWYCGVCGQSEDTDVRPHKRLGPSDGCREQVMVVADR